MSSIAQGFAEAVGNTPLIRLGTFSEETGCEILAKAEFSNPGGSVKDRVAAAILGEATKATTRGGVGEAGAGAGAGASAPPSLRPGGLVAEGTAGSTGVSLAMLSPCFGVRAAAASSRALLPAQRTESRASALLPRPLCAFQSHTPRSTPRVPALPAHPRATDCTQKNVSSETAGVRASLRATAAMQTAQMRCGTAKALRRRCVRIACGPAAAAGETIARGLVARIHLRLLCCGLTPRAPSARSAHKRPQGPEGRGLVRPRPQRAPRQVRAP